MHAPKYLAALISLWPIGAYSAGKPDSIVINIREPVAARWSSAEINVVSGDQSAAGRLALGVENGSKSIKYLRATATRAHGGRTLSIPVDLLRSIENPRIETMIVYTAGAADPSSAPLLLSVMVEFGDPIQTKTLECAAEYHSDWAFNTATFGFDFEARRVYRTVYDPCHNEVDDERAVDAK